jgi:hypothetical protein
VAVRRTLLLLLFAVAGCSSGGLTSQGTVLTGGATTGVAFAPLVPNSPPDLAAVSATRGVVEVWAEETKDQWTSIGSFFAGGIAEEVTSGVVAGKGVVAVRWDVGTIALLPADPNNLHQLLDPYQVYRRVRNNVPVDTTPPAAGMALADLDGDGSDELLVGSAGLGLVIIPGSAMATVLAAVPEKPPPANGYNYNAGPQPGAVTAADVNGDGKLDAVLLDQQQPIALIYGNGGGPANFQLPATVMLPAIGQRVVPTGCASQPVAVQLADGSLVVISSMGKVKPIAAELTPVKALASTHASLAMSYGKDQALALYDACATAGAGVFPNLQTTQIADLAIAPSNVAGTQEMGLLGTDGKTVSLYSLVGY